MQRNKNRYLGVLMMVFAMVIALLMVTAHPVFAATHSPIAGVDVTPSNSSSDSVSEDGVVTITAKGSNGIFGWGKSNRVATITIANSKTNPATISFDWTADKVYKLEIDGASETGTSGQYTKQLDVGGSFTIVLTTDYNDTTNTLKLMNFSSVDLVDANVTVHFSEGNSVSVGGTPLSTGDVVEVPATGTTFVASSENFAAWIDASNNTVLSLEPTFYLQAEADMEIRAIHSVDPAFSVGTTYVGSLPDAIAAAQNGTVKTVVLIKSGTLPTGTYDIPSGITLLLPYSFKDQVIPTETKTVEGTWNSTWEHANMDLISHYTHGDSPATGGYDANVQDSSMLPFSKVTYTLTVDASTTVNVKDGGKLVLGGVIAGGVNSSAGISGSTAGEHANMQLEGTLNVESGGILSVCGYILGDGQVNILNGGTVYQPMIILDFRNGPHMIAAEPDKMLPLNRYTMLNIQADIRINAGGNIKGYVDLYTTYVSQYGITVPERHNTDCFHLIGGSDALINLTTGYVDIAYDTSRYVNDAEHNGTGLYDRVGSTIMTFAGDAHTGSVSLNVSVMGLEYDFVSADNYFGIPYNYVINLTGEHTYEIKNYFRLLPGAEMHVAEEATLKITGNFVVMDGYRDHSSIEATSTTNEWYDYHYPDTTLLQAAPFNGNGAANLIVDGAMTVTGGFAGVVQTNGTGSIDMQGVNKLTFSVGPANMEKVLGLISAPVTGRSTFELTARLFGSDGRLIQMESGKKYVANGNGTNTLKDYTYKVYTKAADNSAVSTLTQTLGANVIGTWQCADSSHSYTENSNSANCTEAGIATYTCSVCGATKTETVGALGHNMVTDAAVAPTCTATGLTEGSHCSRCDYKVEQEVVDALGHDYNAVVTVPNCEAEGYTTHTCSRCSDSYKDTYVDAKGHSYTNYVSDGNATCTEDGTKTATCDNGCGGKNTVADEGSKLGHDYNAVVTAPTCEDQGYTTHTCSKCSDSYKDTYVDAKGHSYTNYVSDGNATCTEDGTKTATCDNGCGGKNTVADEGSKLGHNEEVISGKAATCTETGLTEGKKCTVCGTVTVAQTDIPAKGHTLTQVDAKAPTCTEAGYEAYEYCTVCDYTTYKEVASTGHSYTSEETKAPTCTEKGEMTYTCACGDTYTEEIKEKGHSLTQVDAKAPTCTEAGHKAYEYCSVCDYTTYEEVAATGHSYNAVVTAPTCTTAGYTTYTCACGHSYTADEVTATGHSHTESVTKEPSCTEKGEKTFTCACGDTYTEEIAANGHTLTQVGEKAPTCTEAGYEAYEFCSECDYTTYKEVAATGHSYNAVVTAPTCTTAGYTTYTCACGHSYTADEVTATGHSHTESVTKEPSCTEKGEKTFTCSCGDTYTEEIAANGHTLTQVGAKAPTCTEAGYEAYEYCSKCEYTTYKEVAATGHTHEAVVTAPTCTAKGYTTYTCACGDTYVADEVAALGHKYDAVVTAPTCTEAGYTTYTCHCGDTYTDNVVAALGHRYTESVTKQPTCTEKGEMTYTCSCGDTYTEEIAANGHTLTQVEAKAPTCTEAGYEAYEYCSKCEYTTYKEVAATGHTHEAVVTAPTCTAKGYTTYTCACGDSYVSDYVDALGHAWDDGVITTAPDCETEGVKTYTCGTCGETKTEAVEATGHTAGEAVVENLVESTCTTSGSYDSVVKCSKCGEELSRETITVGALGHSWNNGEITSDPTCTVDGIKTFTCGTCGETKTESVTALGHNMVAVEQKDATCTEDGYTAHTDCSRCDHIVGKEVIPATGHVNTTTTTVDATCTEDGSVTVTCSCGHVVSTTEIPATNHANKYAGDAKDATCTEDGHTAGVYCPDCETWLEEQETILAAHTIAQGAAQDKTCTQDGWNAYEYCTKCDYSTKVVIPAGHTMVQVDAKTPTCTEAGWNAYEYCSVCSHSTKAEIPATGEHSYVNGVCSVCGEVEVLNADVYLTDITLNFAAKIELRPKFNIPAEIFANGNIKVRVIRNGYKGQEITDYSLTQLKMDSNKNYYVAVPFASGELGRTLTIQFIDTSNGSTLGIHDFRTGETTSTITETVANRAIDYMQDAGRPDTLKQLMKAMLVYGGYAQQHFKIDVDTPVFNLLPDFGYDVPSLDHITSDSLQNTGSVSGDSIGIYLSEESAVLDSAIGERVYFKLEAGHAISEYTFKLTVADSKGNETTSEVEVKYNPKKQAYYVEITNIPAAYLDYQYKVEVVHSSGSYVVKTSVMSWVKTTLANSESTQTSINLAKALYYYNEAANAYFGM